MVGPLKTLIACLRKLPGVGEKTATRYAFYILNADPEEVREFADSIRDVKARLRLCSVCFNLTDVDPCTICSNPRRDTAKICVVETPLDLIVIEQSGYFRGLYHVLHGVLSPLDAIGPSDIRLAELLDRVGSPDISEVILAMNPTVEGESTASYIREKIKDSQKAVTRIAYGIPMGGSLEFTDPLTLARSLENRKRI
jgi:recombination protein RecR